MQRNPHLPLELILHIVEASFPPGGPHLITDVSAEDSQLLVAWTQVCRATYELATRFLRQHCVYLNTIDRLQKFYRCLLASKYSFISTLPPTVALADTSSIYIGLDKAAIQSSQTINLIKALFTELGGSVRRLVVDLPFRTLLEDELDPQNNRLLSEGLSALTNIEEFVTTGGLPTLDFWRHETNLWERWPKLERLAGFQVNLAEEGLWYSISRARTLKEVVIARPYLLRIQKWNIKQAIGEHWQHETGGDPSYARRVNICLVNHEFNPPLVDTTDWGKHDPSGLLSVYSLDVPVAGPRLKRVDLACREWLMQAATQGSVWGNGQVVDDGTGDLFGRGHA